MDTDFSDDTFAYTIYDDTHQAAMEMWKQCAEGLLSQ